MKGYVVNKSPLWAHAMKREIRPNGRVKISDLYKQYGKKHNLKKGEEFINWLRTVKLKGDRWSLVLEDDIKETETVFEDNRNDNVTPIVPNKLSIEDITNLTVRAAREVVPELSDLKTLKLALRDASQLANKDSLCRILRKRVQELQQIS